MSDIVSDQAAISLPAGFRFGEIDPPFTRKAGVGTQPVTPLGALAHFVGRWHGDGFNTIFRPDNKATPTSSTLPHPLPPSDNILELNLTTESLTFSPSLGDVPNRGTTPQGDIFLNGVPYLQAITDVTDPDPSKRPGIHVEPGLWMVVPPTSTPGEGITITRMASIPHGTTIMAQGTSKDIAGAPNIPVVKITPFTVNGSQAANAIPFASQTASNAQTARLPQDLSAFIASGRITQTLLDDPNAFLRNRLQKQKIIATTEIKISTQPGKPIFGGPAAATPLFGGGTDNIAFLLGDKTQPLPQKPNAHAIQMEATFWVETVEHTVVLPVPTPGHAPITTVQPTPPFPGQKVPSLVVDPSLKLTAPLKFTFTSTQIQYSQVVMLNFFGLSWPHVSVATLVPADPITLPPAVWAKLVGLKPH